MHFIYLFVSYEKAIHTVTARTLALFFNVFRSTRMTLWHR